ncbi:unnamed protein product [Nesidiocoris tenuis]|uniref:Uncharacterized protein n=1 Tax=Nesidiocoris tenuis TaxID=355587 RepID=A0A6H5HAG8_9HEMI|nr:unnamed protein product [Nesidiocoris tenuis]
MYLQELMGLPKSVTMLMDLLLIIGPALQHYSIALSAIAGLAIVFFANLRYAWRSGILNIYGKRSFLIDISIKIIDASDFNYHPFFQQNQLAARTDLHRHERHDTTRHESTRLTHTRPVLCSDDTSSEKSSDGTTIEPLWTSLIGEGYFWIKKTKPTLKEELNFADVSLNDDDKTVVRAYKVFCRESPVEKAVCVFAEKLKHLQLKKCLALLTQYRQIFKTQFFHPQMKSMDLFGTIVMTLVRYYYNKCDFSATVALINFVDINCRLNPSDYRPYDVQNSIYSQLTESATALMCCDAAYRHLDIKCCSRLFTRYFKNVVSKMDTANVDRMKPLMRMFFQHLISANMPRPLIVFFSNIFEIQENLDHPFNLSEFYGATVSVLAASDDSHDHRLIVNLFLKVSTWMATDLTSVACRGLLVAAAQLNEPRAHIDLIFKDAVYAGAYPHWEPFEWKISLYSVMTKVEMQIYIEQFFHSRAELVWTQRLPICSTFMIFHVEHVSSSPVRDYVYPVQLKMRNVDNSTSERCRDPHRALVTKGHDHLWMFKANGTTIENFVINAKKVVGYKSCQDTYRAMFKIILFQGAGTPTCVIQDFSRLRCSRRSRTFVNVQTMITTNHEIHNVLRPTMKTRIVIVTLAIE